MARRAWLTNGSAIPGDLVFWNLAECTDTILVLTNVAASDAVSYRVIVTNTSGSVTSAVTRLTVFVLPKIASTPSLQHQAADIGTGRHFG